MLRYTGKGLATAEDIARLRALPHTTVLDQTSRMLLVEAPETMSRALGDALPGWVITREQLIPVPSTRPTLRRGVVGPGS